MPAPSAEPPNDSLFDASAYGEPKPKRRQPEKKPLLKLIPPWVLGRYTQKPPLAHLPFQWTTQVDRATGGRWNAFIPECNHKTSMAPLRVDGESLVEVCRGCLDFANKTGLVTILRARPHEPGGD
jgi:hypothetical protein